LVSAVSHTFCYNFTIITLTAGTAVVCLSHCNSVCLSVQLSHGWISQKQCKLGSPNLHCRLPGRL